MKATKKKLISIAAIAALIAIVKKIQKEYRAKEDRDLTLNDEDVAELEKEAKKEKANWSIKSTDSDAETEVWDFGE